MLKGQATANVRFISAVMEVPSKNGGQPFQKRELILDDSWDKDGKHYDNFVVIEFSGEKMRLLDQFRQGQRVTVDYILSGREYNGRVFNTVKGQGITPAQQQQQYSDYAPMPGAYPQRQMPQGYPQQQPTPAYQRQNYPQSYVPPAAPVAPTALQPGQSPYMPYGTPTANDIPFNH